MLRRPSRTALSAAIGVTALLGLTTTAAVAAPTAPAASGDTLYDVAGSAHIQASDTRVAVRRTILTATFDSRGRLRGSLPVPPTRARFSLFGQPAAVTVRFVEVGALTGSEFLTRSGPALTGTGRYVMHLSRLTTSGPPIDLGHGCRTIAPVVMTASTPAGGTWNRAQGGTISGTFTIGGFENCRHLETAIDSTISGAGNDITLDLAGLRS